MITIAFRTSCVAAVLCLCAAFPALALTGNLSTITYLDDSFENRTYAFTLSDEGRLVANRFDGTNWTWVDHGLPPGSESLQKVEALTYVDDSGKRRIYVFVIDNDRRLKLRYLDGTSWKWVDQGGPQLSMSSQSAITYVDPAGNRRIYFFTDVGTLRYNYWNGASWQWNSAGYPPDLPGGTLINVDAITYVDEQGNRRIDVFCRFLYDYQSDLYSYSWNGSSWSWTNLGGYNSGAKAVTYTLASGARRVRVFTRKFDEVLYTRSWDGSSEGTGVWTNLSKPGPIPDSKILGHDVIAFTDGDGNRRMMAFAQFDDLVYSRQWDGSSWLGWHPHGLPSGSGGIYGPSVVTYAAWPTGTRHIHLFVKCADGEHLCDQHYDGLVWKWQDLGAP